MRSTIYDINRCSLVHLGLTSIKDNLSTNNKRVGPSIAQEHLVGIDTSTNFFPSFLPPQDNQA